MKKNPKQTKNVTQKKKNHQTFSVSKNQQQLSYQSSHKVAVQYPH